MASLLLANIPLLPQSPIKKTKSINAIYSPQTSIREKYFSPQTSIHSNRTSSDSDSTLSDLSLTEDSDYEDFVNISTKHVHFNGSTPKVDIQLKLENNEAEFFAHSPAEDPTNTTNKSRRKRDRIRSVFNKKFQRLNSNAPDTEWNEVLAKSLISMHQDLQEIVDGFEQTDVPITDDSLPNTSETLLTKPHLSFRERQREKLEIMRIAQMLNPPNLLTSHVKESPYPYADIIEPPNFNFLRMKKQIPDENLFIQHKPFRHKKFRYRTQRGLLRMRHDVKKIKQNIHGDHSLKSNEELPSLDVQNYRNRLEKTLLEVRRQIYEYDRMHSSGNNKNHRQSISQVIEKMNASNPASKSYIEDYRANIRSVEYVDKKRINELNSAPYIPRRPRYRPDNAKKDDSKDRFIDKRFDPRTFVDINKEAEDLFGPDIPFWDQPSESRLSISSPPLEPPSNHFILPSKLGVWDRFVGSYKTKQKKLRNVELEQSDENKDEFFDCSASELPRRKSQPSSSSNEQNVDVYF